MKVWNWIKNHKLLSSGGAGAVAVAVIVVLIKMC